jgi:ABC-type amino acid transport substrate-binding protein
MTTRLGAYVLMRSIVVAFCVLLTIPCFSADRELMVGVDSFLPCVEVAKDGRCTGFDIDVLEETKWFGSPEGG